MKIPKKIEIFYNFRLNRFIIQFKIYLDLLNVRPRVNCLVICHFDLKRISLIFHPQYGILTPFFTPIIGPFILGMKKLNRLMTFSCLLFCNIYIWWWEINIRVLFLHFSLIEDFINAYNNFDQVSPLLLTLNPPLFPSPLSNPLIS